MNKLRRPFCWSLLIVAPILALIVTPGSAEDKVSSKKLPIVQPRSHKNYTQELPKSKVKFDMVAIPGGTYLMGSPKDEADRDADEGPQHPVTVKAFWMGKCEVTWNEFDVYWKSEKKNKPGAKPEPKKKPDVDAITRPTPPYADETFGYGREGYPLLCITHHTAMEYCRWLTKVTGKQYRLPTEAEWEWACRAGTTTRFSFGDDESKIGEYAWYADNSDESPQKVGQKKPNPWGLYDMHGNLSEWCLDHYEKKAYSKFSLTKPTVMPVFLPSKAKFPHVARGGSWFDDPDMLRSASRDASDPSWIQLDPQRPQSIWWLTSAEFVGFRVVCAVKDEKNLVNLRSKVTKESPDFLDDE